MVLPDLAERVRKDLGSLCQGYGLTASRLERSEGLAQLQVVENELRAGERTPEARAGLLLRALRCVIQNRRDLGRDRSRVAELALNLDGYYLKLGERRDKAVAELSMGGRDAELEFEKETIGLLALRLIELVLIPCSLETPEREIEERHAKWERQADANAALLITMALQSLIQSRDAASARDAARRILEQVPLGKMAVEDHEDSRSTGPLGTVAVMISNTIKTLYKEWTTHFTPGEDVPILNPEAAEWLFLRGRSAGQQGWDPEVDWPFDTIAPDNSTHRRRFERDEWLPFFKEYINENEVFNRRADNTIASLAFIFSALETHNEWHLILPPPETVYADKILT